MMYVVYAMYDPDLLDVRNNVYPLHREYLSTAKQNAVDIVIAGPLLGEDEKTPIGSLIVFEAENRETVTAFYQADPFFTNRVWKSVELKPFDRKR